MKKERKQKGKVTKDRKEQFLVTFAAYNLPTLRSHYKPSPSGAKKSNPIQSNPIQFNSGATSTNLLLLLLFSPNPTQKHLLNLRQEISSTE
jgi:hypothetical protein